MGAWEKFYNLPQWTNLGRKWPFLQQSWKKKKKKKKKLVLPFDKKGKLEDKAQGVLPFLYPMTAFSVKHL